MARRTLVLIRHAKAEPYAANDAERELSPRGREDAAVLGQWLAAEGIAPNVAYVSAATRTRQTWDIVASSAGWPIEPGVDPALYGAGEEAFFDIVRVTDPSVETVVVVGHNPTMGIVAHLLDDGTGPQSVASDLAGFPTGTAAVLELDGEWSDIGPMAARLAAHQVGRAAD